MKTLSFLKPFKSFLSLSYNRFYWFTYNWRFDTRIYNYNLSRAIKPGKRVMIRRNTEIGFDVSIDDYSYISGPINYIESAHIGKFCSIARQTVIGVGDHNYCRLTTHPILSTKDYGVILSDTAERQKNAPKIGNDVWVGINSIILRGVKVGDGAIIAAGSVVTKDIEPYSIVGGVPAKHLKYRFDDDIIQSLLKIKWWDWDIEKIRSESKYMYDIDLFVKRHI